MLPSLSVNEAVLPVTTTGIGCQWRAERSTVALSIQKSEPAGIGRDVVSVKVTGWRVPQLRVRMLRMPSVYVRPREGM